MMNRAFSLCAAATLAVAAAAQVDETFQFVDAAGNEVADGTVITVNKVETNVLDELQMVIPLHLKNVSAASAAVGIYESIDAIPNGWWQTCPLGNCMYLTASGYSPKAIVGAGSTVAIDTEWLPEEGQYATWEAQLQLSVFNIVYKEQFGQQVPAAGDEVIASGPKVTIRFEYTDDTAVRDVRSVTAVSESYDLQGRRVACDKPASGLRIVRRADGSVRKYVGR